MNKGFCGTPGTGECSCAKFGANPNDCENGIVMKWRFVGEVVKYQFVCDKCGHAVYIDSEEEVDDEHPYCPNCVSYVNEEIEED